MSERSSAVRLARSALPFAVSIAALAWIASGVDLGALFALLTPRVAAVLVPAMLSYAAVSLVLESFSLMLLIEDPPAGFGPLSVARIKCASYLLGIVHFALGAGALALLVSRQTRLGLAEAAGRVLLVTFTDLMVIFSAVALGGSLVPELTPALRSWLLAAACAGLGGLALLRSGVALGPFEFARNLPVMRELRTVPTGQLLRLASLRGLFCTSFVAACWAAFVAFEIPAPGSLIVVGMLVVGFIAGLPIAVAGLGTTQLAVMTIFAGYASPETLLAMSLALSTGMLGLRGLMGIVFARELTREAWRERGSVEA